MNRLQHETSPYLLQHAHNPVDWYAWKDEAFERARLEDKPILVSIGYSTCHWCHVMERESFEDADTADFMNEHFINIKVDREERPDVDQIYMDACQIMNGNGGWPLNCFLLPDGRPFYAGTYFPPTPVHGRASWLQVLNSIYRSYRDRKDDVFKQADRLIESIRKGHQSFRQEAFLEQENSDLFNRDLLDRIRLSSEERYDQTYGGFGGAPKFPASMMLTFLLDYHHYTGEQSSIEHVHRSLEHMIRGGIYDQLRGGFARYTVDRAWLVPHFEKMLYDNALLVSLMSAVYRHEPHAMYQRAIEETLAFVAEEMTGGEGGFYSALDADSEGIEGKFYVWSAAEIKEVLGNDYELFALIYGVTEEGNWEGHSILWLANRLDEVAQQQGVPPQVVSKRIEVAKGKLLAHRNLRIRPSLDDKYLLSWNALMISAYCHAYKALQRQEDKDTAIRAIAFVEEKMITPNKELWHTYKEGHRQYKGFLEDYAYWIAALIDAYEITFDISLIEKAVYYTRYVMDNFLDEADNLFYFTSESQQDVPLRPKEVYDNAMPSANAIMLKNLRHLSILTGRKEWELQHDLMLKPMLGVIERHPRAFGQWSQAILNRSYPVRELVALGPDSEQYAMELYRQYYPNTVIMAHQEQLEENYPLLANRQLDQQTKWFVCENYQCQLPVETTKEALLLL